MTLHLPADFLNSPDTHVTLQEAACIFHRPATQLDNQSPICCRASTYSLRIVFSLATDHLAAHWQGATSLQWPQPLNFGFKIARFLLIVCNSHVRISAVVFCIFLLFRQIYENSVFKHTKFWLQLAFKASSLKSTVPSTTLTFSGCLACEKKIPIFKVNLFKATILGGIGKAMPRSLGIQ